MMMAPRGWAQQSSQVRGYANRQVVENLVLDRNAGAYAASSGVNVHTGERFQMDVKVLYNVVADAQVAIFNITQIGETAEKAEQLATYRIEGFMQDLQGLGIAEADMFQDLISFAPYYSTTKKLFSNALVKKPAGFELQKNLHIRFKDGKLINRMLTLAAKHEIYDLVRVEYYVEDVAKVHHEMRLQAMEEVTRRQEVYAGLGMDLREVHRKLAEGHRTYMPQDRYLDYTGVTLIAKETSSEGGNEGDEYRNPRTAFYSPVSYQDFDVVMNPVIMEPVVQFTYTLRLDFEYPYNAPEEETEATARTEAQPKEDRVVYLITPQGEVKLLSAL